MLPYKKKAKSIGAILLILTNAQNSYTAISRKIPNKIKKLSLEQRIEEIRSEKKTTPDIARFKVSFMLQIFQ